MKKLLFILFAALALNACTDLPTTTSVPDISTLGYNAARLHAESAPAWAGLATVAGTLDGPNGTPHMKPGYDYAWETVVEADEYGYLHARRNLYVTYKGRRVTD
jgi:hypothetical protein